MKIFFWIFVRAITKKAFMEFVVPVWIESTWWKGDGRRSIVVVERQRRPVD
jgi:hypothetical protein